MQGDSWKLANVFYRAVPGQAIVKIGNDPKIDSVHTRLLQSSLNHAALAWGGKEDFVYELLASVLEESLEGGDDIRFYVMMGYAAGQLNKALERVAQMANLIKVLTKSVRFKSSADNEDVARIEPAIETTVKQNAIDEAAQAQADGYQPHGFEHQATGNISGSDQVKRPGEQQAGSQAGLGAHSLFVKEVGYEHRRIEMQTPAGNNQREGEPA